jgi:hypothetical protein
MAPSKTIYLQLCPPIGGSATGRGKKKDMALLDDTKSRVLRKFNSTDELARTLKLDPKKIGQRIRAAGENAFPYNATTTKKVWFRLPRIADHTASIDEVIDDKATRDEDVEAAVETWLSCLGAKPIDSLDPSRSRTAVIRQSEGCLQID